MKITTEIYKNIDNDVHHIRASVERNGELFALSHDELYDYDLSPEQNCINAANVMIKYYQLQGKFFGCSDRSGNIVFFHESILTTINEVI